MSTDTCEKSSEILIKKFSIEFAELSFAFECNPDSSDTPGHYNDYIKYSALVDMKKGLGVTFVLLRYENGAPVSILGYITLKATSLISMGENEWEGSPAVEIAELAVRNGEEGRGYGSLLLKAGIVLANKLKENFIGVRYVTVCADHKAVGFYKKVVDFNLAEHHYKLPREQWNMTCVPMYIQLTAG